MDAIPPIPNCAPHPASRFAVRRASDFKIADPTTADPIASILAILRGGERFLVCSHCRPDGDAIGSMLAFGMLLGQMGKQADLVSPDQIPSIYRGLPGVDAIQLGSVVHGPYDAVILLECDGLERTNLQGLEAFFLINIDHHLSGRNFAQLNWIDREAASVGELVYRLAQAAGATLTQPMATCLYTTILTDTGGFCYGATRASTFALAHRLVLAGADPIRIAEQVCFSAPASKMLLLGAALRNLKREGRIAWLWVTHQEIMRTCASEQDCEGIVNFAIGIAGIEAAAFLHETAEGRIRLSLRSKGAVDVSQIAGRLGGGGHRTSAGSSLEGPLMDALQRVLNELRPSMAGLQRRISETA
jgi:phosphoesterase RecJ-like protein